MSGDGGRGTTPAALEDVNLLQEILHPRRPRQQALRRPRRRPGLPRRLPRPPPEAPRPRRLREVRPAAPVHAHPPRPRPRPPGALLPALGFDGYDSWDVLGCRHGRVLIINRTEPELLVFAPVSGELRSVAVPLGFAGDDHLMSLASGAVVCAAAEEGYVHGACHKSPFKVVLVATNYGQAAAQVYSSQTGMWGDHLSAAQGCRMISHYPCTLVGNALYWWLHESNDVMLEFDLDGLSLAVVNRPPLEGIHSDHIRIVRAEDGGVGLAVLSYPSFHLWGRKVSSSGVATWALQKTVNMHEMVGLPSWETGKEFIMGYSDDVHAIFISLYSNVGTHVFMVNLDTMQSKDVDADLLEKSCHPFTSFYPAGTVGV